MVPYWSNEFMPLAPTPSQDPPFDNYEQLLHIPTLVTAGKGWIAMDEKVHEATQEMEKRNFTD